MLRPLFALLPLLFLTAPVGARSPDLPTVTIAESNFRIAPTVIHLTAGLPVRLLFTNASGSSHDFAAPEFFRQAQLLSDPVAGGDVDVPRHGQASVVLVPKKGTYRAHCSHFGHAMFGMQATILVE